MIAQLPNGVKRPRAGPLAAPLRNRHTTVETVNRTPAGPPLPNGGNGEAERAGHRYQTVETVNRTPAGHRYQTVETVNRGGPTTVTKRWKTVNRTLAGHRQQTVEAAPAGHRQQTAIMARPTLPFSV